MSSKKDEKKKSKKEKAKAKAKKDDLLEDKKAKKKQKGKERKEEKHAKKEKKHALDGRFDFSNLKCPGCKKHCPISKPKCGKGKKIAAGFFAELSSEEHDA